jgi:hypothetical protein
MVVVIVPLRKAGTATVQAVFRAAANVDCDIDGLGVELLDRSGKRSDRHNGQGQDKEDSLHGRSIRLEMNLATALINV